MYMHGCLLPSCIGRVSCLHLVLLQDVLTRNQQRDMLEAKRKEKQEAKAEREAEKEAKKKNGPKPRGRPPKKDSKKQHKGKKKPKAAGKRKVKENKKAVKRSKKADPPSKEPEKSEEPEVLEKPAEPEALEKPAAKESKTKSIEDIPKEAEIYLEYVNRAGGVKRFNAAQAVKLGMRLPEIPTFQHCKVIPYWSRGHGGVNVMDPDTKKWRNVAYVGIPGVKDVEVLSMVSQLASWWQIVLSSHLISISLSLLSLSLFLLLFVSLYITSYTS